MNSNIAQKFNTGDKVRLIHAGTVGTVAEVDTIWHVPKVYVTYDGAFGAGWHAEVELELLNFVTSGRECACECGAHTIQWMSGHHSAWCPEAIFAKRGV